MTIAALIDKQDNFEVVRDQIAAILAIETASQQALAVLAGKDSNDWKLRVFTERSNPWEQWLNTQSDTSPIVNVWMDSATYDKKRSNVMERQHSMGLFNIDVYGYGQSANEIAGGHLPGDEQAAKEAQRAFRLVRNIMMAAEYTYLSLRGIVANRWPQSFNVFQPQFNENPALNVVGARLVLMVEFNEFSPQVPEETLELLSVDVKRAEDGQIVAEADYDYTI